MRNGKRTTKLQNTKICGGCTGGMGDGRNRTIWDS